MRDVSAIVLGAGKSTRMGGDLPKVLHPLCGRPMLDYVLEACYEVGVEKIKVVVGHQKDRIIEAFGRDERIEWVEQSPQLGTGHAVMVCEQSLQQFDGDVLVIAGDMPLVRGKTLRRLLEVHRSAGAVVSLASSQLDDPTGYGRIVRDGRDRFVGIVEDHDCTEQQRGIREVNISYYCFDSRALFRTLQRVKPDNAKGEYYITDVVRLLVADGGQSAILPDVPPEDALGVNSPEQLRMVERVMRQRLGSMQPS